MTSSIKTLKKPFVGLKEQPVTSATAKMSDENEPECALHSKALGNNDQRTSANVT